MPSLKLILWPLSLNYQVVVYVRNKLYDWGWLKSVTPKVKTVVVGNLSVGGSGKTPMIEFLLRHWKSSDQLAVLSRGYGRKTKGFTCGSIDDLKNINTHFVRHHLQLVDQTDVYGPVDVL